ncbi:6-carboxytetrahydropterin synthase QueD [Bradyrhizobium sp. Ai1a-2]|uniref:6-carboxytetrahydropterin synthase QueD n=1 Tax=Bradyrhizobium sp. Ai1a-2 TaxID=196490 RepID=UPI0003FAF419|nr:6-carboxytetrahydropterin synthase QueD [Bradyrhizobium sp. Ai1a-2]
MMPQTMKIAATYGFEAAHRLPLLPKEHKCHNLHGHNYRIEVVVEGPVDERGFVMDYAELDGIVKPVVDLLDHKYLNDIPGLENPTSEVLAIWLKTRICREFETNGVVNKNLTIRIFETPRYWVEA